LAGSEWNVANPLSTIGAGSVGRLRVCASALEGIMKTSDTEQIARFRIMGHSLTTGFRSLSAEKVGNVYWKCTICGLGGL